MGTSVSKLTTTTRKVVEPVSVTYPCPLCGTPLYIAQIIDFGTVTAKDGTRRTGKYHRECPPAE